MGVKNHAQLTGSVSAIGMRLRLIERCLHGLSDRRGKQRGGHIR
jgi:hypothetical protein